MYIESVTLRNFRAFKETTVHHLPKMAVLLGANSSGKSSFFDAFSFLRDALRDNVNIALHKRGGFEDVISRGANPKEDTIEFQIGFREDSGANTAFSVITYSLEIGFGQGKAYIENELLTCRSVAGTDPPRELMKFRLGKGYAVANENTVPELRLNQKLTSPDILAIKGLGQFEEFQTIGVLRKLLEQWHVLNFEVDKARNFWDATPASQLSETGDNLAGVTKFMYDNHRAAFETVLEKLPLRIPGITRAEAKETEDGRIMLRFQDKNFSAPFSSRYISDGTLKMFAYLILLHNPEPHPLLCMEEPENFLHPDLLRPLCEEIREYTDRGGQVFISTHSPEFVNGVAVEELFFMEKKEGYTFIKSAAADPVVKALSVENGLGWLWRSHFIEGANL